MANTRRLNSWGCLVLVTPVTLQKPPFPTENGIFPNGPSDTRSAHQCSISQKAIFCGPLCVKIPREPRVFATQQQKQKMLRSHTHCWRGTLITFQGGSVNSLVLLHSFSAPLQCVAHRKHPPVYQSLVLVLCVEVCLLWTCLSRHHSSLHMSNCPSGATVTQHKWFLSASSLSVLSPELPYGWEKIEDPQFGTYYVE